MAITIVYRNQEYRFEQKKLVVSKALEHLNLSVETHLVVKDGELITENDVLANGDVARIVPVISGG
jgi:sulfur carrier protein ThiS